MKEEQTNQNSKLTVYETKQLIKQTAYETRRLPLNDPIDGVSLCNEIAKEIDWAISFLQSSAKENGVEIIEMRVSFKSDTEDGHSSGRFRIVATGKEMESAK